MKIMLIIEKQYKFMLVINGSTTFIPQMGDQLGRRGHFLSVLRRGDRGAAGSWGRLGLWFGCAGLGGDRALQLRGFGRDAAC